MGNLLKRKQFIQNVTKELLGNIKSREELFLAMDYLIELLRQEIRKSLSDYIIPILEEGWDLIEELKLLIVEQDKLKYKLPCEEVYNNLEAINNVIREISDFLFTERRIGQVKFDRSYLYTILDTIAIASAEVLPSRREHEIGFNRITMRWNETLQEEYNSYRMELINDILDIRDTFKDKEVNHEKQRKKQLKDKSYSAKEVISMLKDQGYELERTGKGSHQVFKNEKGETVIISNHKTDVKTGLKNKYLERIYNI